MKHIENGVRTRKPIKPRSKSRPGRLKGVAMEALRLEAYLRDRGKCVVCGRTVWLRLDQMCSDSMHLAHRRNKRMFGDNIDNVDTSCGDCHREYHQRGPSRQKVCPAKPKPESASPNGGNQ